MNKFYSLQPQICTYEKICKTFLMEGHSSEHLKITEVILVRRHQNRQ